MKKESRTYTMHDIETERGTLTVYVDDETKKVHHGVYYDSKHPRTLYPCEPNARENVLDGCAGMYTLQQVKSKLRNGTITFQ